MRSEAPKPRKRRSLALLCGLLLAIGGAELVLSRFEAFRPYPRFAPGERADELTLSTFLQPDSAVGWSMRPSIEYRHTSPEFDVTYRSNAAGFRSPHDYAADGLGRPRVLLVGDSYTFGIGVEGGETFGGQLEATSDWTVCNVAMPGFAVDQMWLQTRAWLPKLRPDLVIVAICDADLARSQTAYSLSNGMNKPAFRLEGGELVQRTDADRMSAIPRFFEHRSRLWMGFRQLTRRLGYSHPIGEWWKLNEAVLDKLHELCASRGVQLVVVYVPTPERRPFATLAAYAERTGLDYVDLTDGMPRDGMFFPKDRHFTAAGHEFAAQRILETIGPAANGAIR